MVNGNINKMKWRRKKLCVLSKQIDGIIYERLHSNAFQRYKYICRHFLILVTTGGAPYSLSQTLVFDSFFVGFDRASTPIRSWLLLPTRSHDEKKETTRTLYHPPQNEQSPFHLNHAFLTRNFWNLVNYNDDACKMLHLSWRSKVNSIFFIC